MERRLQRTLIMPAASTQLGASEGSILEPVDCSKMSSGRGSDRDTLRRSAWRMEARQVPAARRLQ